MIALVWGVSAALFIAGLCALILRRQLLAMILGLELMIAAANIPIVYYANLYGDPAGLAAVLLILAVAASEAVLGLGLIIELSRADRAAVSDALRELKG